MGLLEKLISENRPISYLADESIPAEAFKSDEVVVFEFISEHYKRHGRMPKIDTVEQHTEVDLHGYPNEPIGYWLDGLKDRHVSDLILTGHENAVAQVSQGNVEDAVGALQSLALELSSQVGTDRVATLAELAPNILTTLDARRMSPDIMGVPFGLPYLDEISDGAHGGDTVAIVGRPGVGKSYILSSMCNHSYLNHGDIPLVVTMEMSSAQWVRRAIALKAGVSATFIRVGKLSNFGRNVLSAGIDSVVAMGERPYYILEGSLKSTVEDLGMRVQELRPTVVYVDGAYLMQSRSKSNAKWETVTTIAEYQKMIAKDFNIPVIATWQFNRKGPGSLGNISYSDAIGQLASIVCAIMDEKVEGGGATVWTQRSYKILKLLKGREGEKGSMKVLYDMGRMIIEQHSVLSGYELEGTSEDEGDDYDAG
jgi:replicative DNA helicase